MSDGRQALKLFFRTIHSSGDALEVLEVHVAVEAQAALDFTDDVGRALEGVVHVRSESTRLNSSHSRASRMPSSA